MTSRCAGVSFSVENSSRCGSSTTNQSIASEKSEDIKLVCQLIQTLLQCRRYGNALREPFNPFIMALFARKPHTLDARQSPGFPDGAHGDVDIPFEKLNRAERIHT
jgi:hypothetical protein